MSNYDDAVLALDANASSMSHVGGHTTETLSRAQTLATLALVDAHREANEHALTANMVALLEWIQGGDPSTDPDLYKDLARDVADRLDKANKISNERN